MFRAVWDPASRVVQSCMGTKRGCGTCSFCARHNKYRENLAFCVADPCADDAIAAAISVAGLACDSSCAINCRGVCPGMRAADVDRVDRERRTGTTEAADHLALLTLALGSRAQRCGLGRQVVERIAECAAPAGRKRARRLGLGARRHEDRNRGQARRKMSGTHRQALSRKPGRKLRGKP